MSIFSPLKWLICLVVVIAIGCGIWRWAMVDPVSGGPIGPTPGNWTKEQVREAIISVIGEAKTELGTADRRVQAFRNFVTSLRKAMLRVNLHLQKLDRSEQESHRRVEAIEGELQYMKKRLHEGKPIQEGLTERPLSAAEVTSRIELRAVELTAARECLAIISAERGRFSDMYAKQMEQLRTAPAHLQALKVQMDVLRTKHSLYRQRLETLDGIEAGFDAYSTLYEEAKTAIQTASMELDGAAPAETSLKPLLIESSEGEITKSESRVKSQVTRIDEILAHGAG